MNLRMVYVDWMRNYFCVSERRATILFVIECQIVKTISIITLKKVHVFLCNIFTDSISLFLFHADDNTEYTLLTTHNISGGSYESIFTVDRPLYLHAGDIIKCTAGTADKLVVTTSAEEFYDSAR